MARPLITPLGAVARGILAGAAGTAAMDLVWFLRYKRGGGGSGLLGWEFSAGLNDWGQASAPALMGKRLYEGFTQRELSAKAAPLTTTVMHWGYGLAWAALYGVVAGSLRRPPVRAGLVLGPAVWSASYVVLPLAKLYKPIWEYDAGTLWKDLSAHLVYGLATAATFRALVGR